MTTKTILDKLQSDIDAVWNSVKDDYKEYHLHNPHDNCRSDLSDFAISTADSLHEKNYVETIISEIKDGTISLSDIGVDEEKIDFNTYIKKDYINDTVNDFLYDQVRETFYKRFDELCEECDRERNAQSSLEVR